jgi:hypothetical protein
MRRTITCLFAFLLLVLASYGIGADAPAQPAADKQAKSPQWAMNATIIEACSCPMFCQCYFDSKPAAHSDKDPHAGHAGHEAAAGAEHYCKFNNAYQVNKGSYGDVKLDGAKFWLGGDLGGDFSQGKMNWAVLTFDPSVKPEQREGIKTILGHVYPVTWKSFTVAEDKPVEWKAMKDGAEARLAGGKAAEVVLKKNEGMNDEPIVIKNLRYWGTPRNDGFVLMQNEVEALRQVPEGQKPFEFKRTNGFMITFDIKSEDVGSDAKKKM